MVDLFDDGSTAKRLRAMEVRLDLLGADIGKMLTVLNRIDRRARVARAKHATMPATWVPRHEYIDEWNAAASRSVAQVPAVPKMTPGRARLLREREKEEAFDWRAICDAVVRVSPRFVEQFAGFGFDWLIRPPSNGAVEPYVKLIEGRYEAKAGERAAPAASGLAGFFEG